MIEEMGEEVAGPPRAGISRWAASGGLTTRPLSAAFLLAAVLLLAAIALPALRAKREEAMQE